MWKLIVAFLLFAAVALWLLSKGGNVDISGEKHGIETSPAAASSPAAEAAPASMPAPMPMPMPTPMPAASAPVVAASVPAS